MVKREMGTESPGLKGPTTAQILSAKVPFVSVDSAVTVTVAIAISLRKSESANIDLERGQDGPSRLQEDDVDAMGPLTNTESEVSSLNDAEHVV